MRCATSKLPNAKFTAFESSTTLLHPTNTANKSSKVPYLYPRIFQPNFEKLKTVRNKLGMGGATVKRDTVLLFKSRYFVLLRRFRNRKEKKHIPNPNVLCTVPGPLPIQVLVQIKTKLYKLCQKNLKKIIMKNQNPKTTPNAKCQMQKTENAKNKNKNKTKCAMQN